MQVCYSTDKEISSIIFVSTLPSMLCFFTLWGAHLRRRLLGYGRICMQQYLCQQSVRIWPRMAPLSKISLCRRRRAKFNLHLRAKGSFVESALRTVQLWPLVLSKQRANSPKNVFVFCLLQIRRGGSEVGAFINLIKRIRPLSERR
jgi:hypothetical protein